ncbi:MAG: hypothetical protein QNJ55_25945 [Xenococcus sp. MO_188.B8]|nr:hypothetical protein [Xenococcus sp. MO_188.B8]
MIFLADIYSLAAIIPFLSKSSTFNPQTPMNISNNMLGIMIGGILPALLYGVSIIAMKAGAEYKISTSSYLMVIGIVIFIVGLLSKQILNFPRTPATFAGLGFAIASGALWALGTTLVNYSMVKFGTPIAILTPLYNMNTLVAVLGGMLLFAEWKTVQSLPVFIGTILVVCGGVLLSKS